MANNSWMMAAMLFGLLALVACSPATVYDTPPDDRPPPVDTDDTDNTDPPETDSDRVDDTGTSVQLPNLSGDAFAVELAVEGERIDFSCTQNHIDANSRGTTACGIFGFVHTCKDPDDTVEVRVEINQTGSLKNGLLQVRWLESPTWDVDSTDGDIPDVYVISNTFDLGSRSAGLFQGSWSSPEIGEVAGRYDVLCP